jgi:unsaturated chondroitin disaccharide hydrolase
VHGDSGGRRRAAGGALTLALVWALLSTLVAPAPRAEAAADPREAPLEVALRSARTFALHQLARTDRRLAPDRFPTVAVGSAPWRTSGTNGWLAGFWPGRLWLAYELTGDRAWARRAVHRQAPLVVRQDDTTTHDLGFLLQTSFGGGADLLGRAGDAAVVRRGAQSLASRYVPAVGAIRSWDGPAGETTVIVDSLMNLGLLLWAADHGGSARWRDVAVQHALTVSRWLVRPDGSTYHVVRFDESTGLPVWRGTVQGYADWSTWARGQSWAVHGFATAYAESRDPRLLAAARATAGFAVDHLPADGVPWWDYDDPGTRRDTTAAAVLASGLLDLARLDPDAAQRSRWRSAGVHTLRSLVGPRYLARGTGAWSVLLHGRHDPTYDDAGVTYGDHYLLEAMLRAQLLPSRRAAQPATVRRLDGGGVRADLGRARPVSAVSVRWRHGGSAATRFLVQTSPDGGRWTTVRGGVSSRRTAALETYDLRDRVTRFVRVRPLGATDGTRGRVLRLVVRR